MIDYVFRYDPSNPSVQRTPATADEAREALIRGNRVFSEWMANCRCGGQPAEGSQYVIPCGGLEAAFEDSKDEYPVQRPFAVVLGCSDARVPTEMLFGQGFNDLFVIRVAGNVLGDAVQGTIDFSVSALSDSVRTLVVLGHTNCGAVKGAVETYLDPKKFWSRNNSPALRLTFQRIFVAVRESDNVIRHLWGIDAPQQPGYREALIDASVCLNAAHMAFALRQQVEAAAKWDIEVLFGVYDIRTHQVCMPLHPPEVLDPANVNLARAPGHPRDFDQLAVEVVTARRPPDRPPRSRSKPK
jgi:carbonic anhydrase